MRARYGPKRHIEPRDRVAMQQRHPRPRAADRALLDPTLAAPPYAIFSVPPPRAAHRQDQTHPVGQPQAGRQPRRQRRVARPSGTATVCTESRENPRTAPFRVPLPWPPRGGLGAGGQGVIDASQIWPEKTYRTPRPRRNTTKPSAPPGRRAALLAPTLAAPQQAIFFVPPAKGSAQTNTDPPCGAEANRPPTTSSAPRRPPIGHRDSVHGKPRKAANPSIPRPTPLAP